MGLVLPFLLAQSIDPYVFGTEFCWLRQRGFDRPEAISRAVDYAWRPRRSAIGRDADVEAAKYYVRTNCDG